MFSLSGEKSRVIDSILKEAAGDKVVKFKHPNVFGKFFISHDDKGIVNKVEFHHPNYGISDETNTWDGEIGTEEQIEKGHGVKMKGQPIDKVIAEFKSRGYKVQN
jgi:hypothetical protein